MGFLDRFKSDTSSPDALTLEVATRIKLHSDVDDVAMVDADIIAVTWAGRATPHPLDISEIRPTWKRATGFERIDLLDNFLAGLHPPAGDPMPADTERSSEAPGDRDGRDGWEEVAPQLFPALAASAPDDVVSWAVGGLLHATVVRQSSGAPVTRAECAAWKVRADDAVARAVANLSAIDPGLDAIAPDSRAWVPTQPDGRQSSWLTAPARLLAELGLESGIALVPVAGEMVVVDPDDPALLESVLTSTLTILEHEPDRLCPMPFRVTPDHVAVWQPRIDDPASELVERARQLFDR